MSLPHDFSEPDESLPQPVADAAFGPAAPEPVLFAPLEPVAFPVKPSCPAWSWWDLLAVLGFSLFAVLAFSVTALFVAHSFPQYRNAPISELVTNARIIVGAQAAAYPFVLLGIFFLVRSRANQRFRDAIQWNWPGRSALMMFASGVILAVTIEGLSRFLPMPKSLPVDSYFTDATSAYIMAAFGTTLAPLLEEVLFRGLLYPLARRSFGLVAAIAVTALAFAGIHGAQLGYAWAPVLSIFVVGVAFTSVRARTSSVANSFMMHCGYNFTLFAMLWLASDHYRHLEKVSG
ncbi:MAG: type II CAAX endopeptidase family protein [Acidobacteriota bacterium]|nr:type II CAAX endopeptidase family protein [Acidobacteriota bacterium]